MKEWFKNWDTRKELEDKVLSKEAPRDDFEEMKLIESIDAYSEAVDRIVACESQEEMMQVIASEPMFKNDFVEEHIVAPLKKIGAYLEATRGNEEFSHSETIEKIKNTKGGWFVKSKQQKLEDLEEGRHHSVTRELQGMKRTNQELADQFARRRRQFENLKSIIFSVS